LITRLLNNKKEGPGKTTSQKTREKTAHKKGLPKAHKPSEARQGRENKKEKHAEKSHGLNDEVLVPANLIGN